MIPKWPLIWQTAFNLGQYCSTAGTNNQSLYGNTMANGINNGGQLIEIQADAAFTDLSTCAPALGNTVSYLLDSAVPPGICTYG